MKQLILALLWVALAESAFAERLYGLERMERVDRLPELLGGARAFQISSRDRRGANDDGYFATAAFLYVDANGEKVLYDEQQSGCLYRFWMTFSSPSVLTNRLRFYFDGEASPRIDLTVGEFFSGTNAPFLFPMVGNGDQSCRGYYSYCPFPYAESLKVTISSVPTNTGYGASPFYYNMTAHQFDSAEGVDTWNGTEDMSVAIAMLSQTGTDPKPTNGNTVVSGTVVVGPGQEQILYAMTEGGVVQRIHLDPAPATWPVLRDCSIRMDWDGGGLDVDVPLGAFFGSATNELEVASLPIGMGASGDWYCYFPMPFWTSAVVSVRNNATVPISIPFELQVASNAYDRARCGYFRAVHRSQYIVSDGRDVIFADETGRGHFVGLSLFIRGDDYTGNNLDHLEGDERIHVDSSLSPSLYGTGTEDYFNCAWYFQNAPALLPYHGVALQEFHSLPPNATQAYRFHLTDVVPFNTRFRFGMEHGRANNTRGLYDSVAYFYMLPAPGMEQTAAFDVQEGAFDYEAWGGVVAVSNDWRFEGNEDHIAIHAQGLSFAGGSRFRIPAGTNAGMILRRLTDRGVGKQGASVFVDGAYAGHWFDGDCNFVTARVYNTTAYVDVLQRWNESEFLLPASLTAGKESIGIELVRDSDAADTWNEYHYQAFRVVPLGSPGDVDRDGLPDKWETAFYANVGAALPNDDSDHDGFSTREEWIALTSPTSKASRLQIENAGNRYGFLAGSNRNYTVWASTNLVQGSWWSTTNLPGTGLWVDLQPSTSNVFYRIGVELDE